MLFNRMQIHLCLCSDKNCQEKFNEKLKERLLNLYYFSNHDNNKFTSLFKKGILSYEYMVDSKKMSAYS